MDEYVLHRPRRRRGLGIRFSRTIQARNSQQNLLGLYQRYLVRVKHGLKTATIAEKIKEDSVITETFQ